MRAAAPLARHLRGAFLLTVADRLAGRREIGDGLVGRVVAETQRQFFDPPRDTVKHVARHDRKDGVRRALGPPPACSALRHALADNGAGSAAARRARSERHLTVGHLVGVVRREVGAHPFVRPKGSIARRHLCKCGGDLTHWLGPNHDE
jgi:hypothetical protein